ncbi:MAG: hypothetical protein J7501_07210 [Bdellovibrio sp.]|nr:hypothetical protein [Bdellovibrio sp.]
MTSCSPGGSSEPKTPGANNQESVEKPGYHHSAEGFIGGRAWRYVQGKATPFRRNNKNYLEVRLWNQDYNSPCTEPMGSAYQVRIYVSYSEGSWKIDPLDPFSLIPTIIFSDYTTGVNSRSNLIADIGLITVSSLKHGRLVGSVVGQFTDSNNVGRTEVKGDFEVPVCAP